MKKILLSLFSLAMTISCLHAQTITEFHYDNAGGDVGEFVEVIIPADGCTYSIEFYNGSSGASYGTETVPACDAPSLNVCGTAISGCVSAVFPNSIQNGAPDGFALVQDCAGTIAVIEFLSYEGTITAVDGPAAGMTSTDVGVGQSSSTPVGSSITVTAGVGVITDVATPGECPADGPLAITLTNFNATPIDGSVMLEWSTGNETNNDFFVVEHSFDGLNFTELETIKGAGSTTETESYNFKHENVANGINYYRLKQVDLDGQFTLTAIKSVDVKSDNTIIVTPTLVAEHIRVSMSENLTIDTPIHVFNITGQSVLTTYIAGDNNTKDIDVADLISGTYFLILNIDGDIQTTKFMKL